MILPRGTKINFWHHVVRVGLCLIPPVMPLDLGNSLVKLMDSRVSTTSMEESQAANVSTQKAPITDRDNQGSDDPSSAVFDSISLGLDFSQGTSMARDIKKWFNCPVHPTDNSPGFSLVVSFGRSTFHLTEDTVGLALEAAIGGYCGMLKVSSLRERVFSFLVVNQHVGFHIVQSQVFECKNFKCYFHLWGFGGPNWQSEFRLWQQECDQQWTLISPSK
jgi:hypothetical protein